VRVYPATSEQRTVAAPFGHTAIAQHDCHAALCAAGALVFVAAGWEAAADFLCAVVPMRDCRAFPVECSR
jgi:hypothetical protein